MMSRTDDDVAAKLVMGRLQAPLIGCWSNGGVVK